MMTVMRWFFTLGSASVVVAAGVACSSAYVSDPGPTPDGGAEDATVTADVGAADGATKSTDASTDAGNDGGVDAGGFVLQVCDGGILTFTDDSIEPENWALGQQCAPDIVLYGKAGTTIECDGPAGAFDVLTSGPAIPTGAAQVAFRVVFLDPGDGGPAVRHTFAQLIAALGPQGNLVFSYDPHVSRVIVTSGGADIAFWDNITVGPYSLSISLPAVNDAGVDNVTMTLDGRGANPITNVARAAGSLQIGPYMSGAPGHAKNRYSNVAFWACP